MTKNELKSIIKECIIEEGYNIVNEGLLFKTPAYKKIKEEIKNKLASCKGNSTVKDRLTGRVRILDKPTIDRVNKFMESYLKCCSIANLVEITTNYVTSGYEQYYYGIVHNEIVSATVRFAYDGKPVLTNLKTTEIDKLDIDKSVIEIVMSNNKYKCDIHFKKNIISFHGGYGVDRSFYSKSGGFDQYLEYLAGEILKKDYTVDIKGSKLILIKN